MSLSVGAFLFIIFAVLLLLSVPISVSLGISSILALMYAGSSITIKAQNLYNGMSKFLLLAIPFFILAGNIMEFSGISGRLIKLADSMMGHIRGGIAITCVMVSCFFAAISGSAPATVAALGLVVIPAMVQAGYGKETSSALMATSGSLGIVIPPSIAFVVYASLASVSVGKIFIAGILPGLLTGLFLALMIFWVARKRNIVAGTRASTRERLAALADAFWGLMMPLIILGGIYGGFFTPTEAAAVSVVYGFFVGAFVYKKIRIKDVSAILITSMKQSASTMFIIGTATLFGYVCTTQGVVAACQDWLNTVADSPVLFILVVNIILLIAGCFLEATSAMYILIPILLPVATSLGIDPVHFGVIVVCNLAAGCSTPPVGINLFVACKIGNVSMEQISKAVGPFIIAQIVALLFISYIPGISLWLPSIL